MYPCRDPTIFYILFLQPKTIRKSITKKILSRNNELCITNFKNSSDLQQTPKKISDSSIHTKNYISLWLQKYVVLGTHCTEQTSSFSSTYVVRSSQYLFCIPSMILWRAELKRRGVAPPAPTVPRKGATGGATGGAHAAATGGALGWCPVCTSSATEAFAPPKGASPSHGTTGAAAAQGCHAAPPVAPCSMHQQHHRAVRRCSSWRLLAAVAAVRRCKQQLQQIEMATYQRAASSSREIFSRKTFPLVQAPLTIAQMCYLPVFILYITVFSPDRKLTNRI